MKVSEGRKAWVKNPEKLENCSTGFHFPQQDKESVKGQVIIILLLHNISIVVITLVFNGKIKMWECRRKECRA